MNAAVWNWFNDVEAWVSQAWQAVADAAPRAVNIGAEFLVLIVGLSVLAVLAPVLAHLCMLLVMGLLGAPLWFVVSLLFSH